MTPKLGTPTQTTCNYMHEGCPEKLFFDPEVNGGMPKTDKNGFPEYHLVCPKGHRVAFKMVRADGA